MPYTTGVRVLIHSLVDIVAWLDGTIKDTVDLHPVATRMPLITSPDEVSIILTNKPTQG